MTAKSKIPMSEIPKTVKRNRYDDGTTYIYPHTSKHHFMDLKEFHLPLARMQHAALHDWGIAEGLEVSGAGGDTEVLVSPGVAFDGKGELIALAVDGWGDIGRHQQPRKEVPVPVHLPLAGYAAGQYYLTIQHAEVLRSDEGSGGRLELVPWLRLQPPVGEDLYVDNGSTVVLAIVGISAQGTLATLEARDNVLPYSRRLGGHTLAALRLRRSLVSDGSVAETAAGTLAPNAAGGLRITVPNAGDQVLFACDNDKSFAGYEVRANTSIRGELIVSDAASLGSLSVNGATTLGSLSVNGAASLKGDLTLAAGKKATLHGDLQVDGVATLGSLTVSDAASLGSLSVTGAATFNVGNTALRFAEEAGAAVLRVENSAAQNVSAIDLSVGAQHWQLRVDGADSNKLKLYDATRIADALTIDQAGNVGIGTTDPQGKLDVRGAIHAGGSAIYFTETSHNHTGFGNTIGFAAIENSADIDALTIFGRTGTSQKRTVKLWDYLQVNGNLVVTENVGIGTPPSANYQLEVAGSVGIRGNTIIGAGGNGILKLRHIDGKHWQNDDNDHLYLNWGTGKNVYLGFGNDTLSSLLVSGNVGIGTTTPLAKLQVNGNLLTTGDIQAEGTIWSVHGYKTGHMDLAENYTSDQDLRPGEVVCLSRQNESIIRSETINDVSVIGVISTDPGFLLNAAPDALDSNIFPVALRGRVPCKVTDQNGAIQPGDLLTTSATPGHAMKARPVMIGDEAFYRPATIIGKALEPLEAGAGVIEIFMALS